MKKKFVMKIFGTIQRKCRFGHRLSFSLVELLICLSIMSLLLSLLQQSLSSLHQKSVRLSCQRNLSTQGVAASLYLEDEGHYPVSSVFDKNVDNAWKYQIGYYLRGKNYIDPKGFEYINGLFIHTDLITEELLCPESENIFLLDIQDYITSMTQPGRKGGYGWNLLAQNIIDPKGKAATPLTEFEIDIPSETFMIADTLYPLVDPPQFQRLLSPSLKVMDSVIYETHQDKINTLHFDIHVSAKTDGEIRYSNADPSYFFRPTKL